MSREFNTILTFYDDRRAKRSDLPLIRHILEGLRILDFMQASELTKKAFCLHPIVQNNEALDVSWSEAFPLACEYRDVANRYLCRPENDWVTTVNDIHAVVGPMSKECAQMLVADKRQNYADFIQYHYLYHGRSEQLDKYFRLWICYLETRL